MAGRYPVKFFDSSLRDAPTINGTPGSFINVLKKCLIEGFGEVSAVNGIITDGVCTIYFNSGESFKKNRIILIDGTNLASVNGEQRVADSTNSSISFPTTESNQALIGSIVVKYAPVGGWIAPFTGTNRIVLKATSPSSSGVLFYIDDTNALYATMRMYGVMTSLDAGIQPVPFENEDPFIFTKSYQANPTARMWEFIADDYTAYYGINRGMVSSEENILTKMISFHGFGDFVEEGVQAFGNAFVRAATAANSYNTGTSSSYQSATGMGFSGGTASSRLLTVFRNIETNAYEARNLSNDSDINITPFASGAMGSSMYNNIHREISITRTSIQGYSTKDFVPGWYIVNNTLPPELGLKHHEIFEDILGLEGKKFLVICESSYTNSTSSDGRVAFNNSKNTSSSFSFSLVDITGPWR